MHPLPTVLAALLLPAALSAAAPQSPAERINLTSAGLQTGGFANEAVVSADGRYVAFQSEADDVVAGDSNFSRDVFVRDRLTGTTERVSVGPGGAQGNGHSDDVSISADGRFVLFSSSASNLVPGDTNGARDVFLRDRQAGTTTRVSEGPGGQQADSWSDEARLTPDAGHAVFTSTATNMLSVSLPSTTGVYVRDLATGVNVLVSVDSGGVSADLPSWAGAISDDGTVVAFQTLATNLAPDDTNTHLDVYVRDLAAGTTTRVSESTAGVQGNSYSQLPVISGDGRFLAFQGWASDLVSGDTNSYHDIFVYDRLSDAVHRVNLDQAGGETNEHSYAPSLSDDGRWVVYESFASDLVVGDTNGASDIFLVDFLGDPACPPATTYCSSKESSIPGCVAQLDFSGAPSATAGSGFVITAGPTPGQNAGLFLYTTGGSAAAPLQTPFGSLCLAAPFLRIAPQSAGGATGTCSGQYTVDFNLHVATQTADPSLVVGAQVDVQAWFRDPQVAGGAIFSEAGRFLLCP